MKNKGNFFFQIPGSVNKDVSAMIKLTIMGDTTLDLKLKQMMFGIVQSVSAQHSCWWDHTEYWP